MMKISFILLVFSLPLAANSFPTSAEQSYTLASTLYRDHQFQRAIEAYDDFARVFPQSPMVSDAYFNSAECLFNLKQIVGATQRYKTLLRKYPGSRHADQAMFRLGEIAFAKGNYPTASSEFKKILDVHAESKLAGEAAYWIGEATYRTDDLREALKFFDLSHENYPDNRLAPDALFSAAWVLQQLKEYKRSADSFKQLLVRFPESEFVSSAALRAGECYYALRDSRKTIDHLVRYRSLITQKDERAEADYLLGESYLSLGDNPNALFSYESFLKSNPDNHLDRAVKYSRGWTFLKEMNYEMALQIFAELQGGSDEVARGSLFRKGVAQKLSGDPMAALATFNECVDSGDSFSDDALYEIGLLFYDAGDYLGARTAFREMLREYPSSNLTVQALRMRGEAEVALGRYKDALQAFQTVAARKDLLPDFQIDVNYQICWTLLKLKRYTEAAEGYSQFLQKNPKYEKADEAYFWLGESYFYSGNIEQAQQSYGTVINNYPMSKKFAEALYGMGWTYYRSGNCSDAIASFEKAIQMQRLAPDVQFDALLRTGGCHFDAKNYVAAGGAYRTIVRRFPEKVTSPFILCRLAFCNGEIGDYDDAMDMYEDAMARWPQSQFIDDAVFGKGEVYVKAQDDKKAIEEFRLLINQFPTSEYVPHAYFRIVDAYTKLKQPRRVVASLEEILKKYPGGGLAAEAKMMLHQTYLALNMKLKAAKLQKEIDRDAELRAKEVQ